MFTSASGRSALILTAALVCFAAPSQPAAAADDAVKAERSDAAAAPVTLPKQANHSSQRSKKHAARRSGKNVGKSDAVPNANATDQRDGTAVIPASVANANAQWQYTETPTGAAKAMSARSQYPRGRSPTPARQPDRVGRSAKRCGSGAAPQFPACQHSSCRDAVDGSR